MAIDADNLDIILRVIGLRTFQAQMAEARGSVASVGKAAVASDEAMAASSRKTMTGLAMLRKVGLGVAASLAVTAGEAYKLSIEYQRQVEMIHADAGLSQRDTDRMYKSILSMAREFPQGPDAFAKGAYHMASVTHDAQLSLEGLRASAQLATVGNSDLESTTSAVAAVWRAAEGEGLSFRQIVATLNATVGAGNMRMQDLVQALGTGVIPVFKTAGLHLEDFGAALALLTDEGQHADNAATHLRMAVNLLAAPSKLARKELRGIGLDALDLSDQMKSPNGLINSLSLLKERLYQKYPGEALHDPKQIARLLAGDPDTFHSLTHAQSQRMNVLSRAFGGARSGATIMALIDQLDSLQKKQAQVHNTTKNFGDSLAKTLGLPAIRLHTAVSNLSVDLIDFGDQIRGPVTVALLGLLTATDRILRALKWTIGAVKSVVHWYKQAPEPIKLTSQALGILVGEILIYQGAMKGYIAITTLAAVVTGVFTDAIEVARIAMYVFVMDNPILVAIAAIILILILVVTHWKWFKHAAVDAFHWVLNAAAVAWKWIRTHWYLLFPLGAIVAAVVLIISNFSRIRHAAATAFNWVKHAAGDAWNFIKKHWQVLATVLGGPFVGMALLVRRNFGRIKHDVLSVLHYIAHVWNSTLGRIHLHIPGWVPGVGGHHFSVPKIGNYGTGGIIPLSPFGALAQVNDHAAGETVYLPRGSSIQPSSASSIAVPRAHVPNPAPRPDNKPIEITIHNVMEVDRKVLYKSVTRASADAKARRGG